MFKKLSYEIKIQSFSTQNLSLKQNSIWGIIFYLDEHISNFELKKSSNFSGHFCLEVLYTPETIWFLVFTMEKNKYNNKHFFSRHFPFFFLFFPN